MARGWESKSVEDQQQAAQAQGAKPAAPPLDPAEAARAADRATLQLARTRALADLQQACAPAHRAMLEHAIRDLDQKIALLMDRRV
jgi:hypothetical protein